MTWYIYVGINVMLHYPHVRHDRGNGKGLAYIALPPRGVGIVGRVDIFHFTSAYFRLHLDTEYVHMVVSTWPTVSFITGSNSKEMRRVS